MKKMNRSSKRTAGLLLIVSLQMTVVQATAQQAQSLYYWLQTARQNNPLIRAASANAEAKNKDIIIAPSLPEPTVSGGAFIIPVETRVGPQQGKIGISQMVPWPGKLTLKKRVAEKEFAAALEALRTVEAKIFAEVRSLYAEYYALGREVSILRDNLTLLQQMESVLLSRFEAGIVPQSSLLKVQVEMAVLEDKLRSFSSDSVKIQQGIFTLLNIPSDTVFDFPSQLPVLPIPDGVDTLLEQAMERNPALLEALYEQEAASAQLGLARRSFAPDFMFSTDYIFTGRSSSSMVSSDENGKNPWSVGAGITIPLWIGKNNAQINKAKAMESRRNALATNTRNLTQKSTISLFEEYNDALRKISLYEQTLIPQSRQVIALVEEAYINARATVLDYLDAQRTLLRLEVELAMQNSRRETVAGRIDMLLGGELTRQELGE